ncbi:hypothetical protein GQ457_17G013750 [Hibiscus cannabinus]
MTETIVLDSEFVGRRETRQEKAKRASSKDMLTTLEGKELDAREDKLKEEFQGLIKETIENVDQQDNSLKEEVIALKKMVEELIHNEDKKAPKLEIMVLKNEVEELRGELWVYKIVVANGVMSGTLTAPIDIPKPKDFKGTRNAQDIENYIWEIEQYFQAANITKDTKKCARHPRIHRTIALVTDQYYWLHRDRDIEVCVKTCLVCQQEKVETKKPMGLFQPLPIPERPWESISLDLLIGLPNIDNCSSIMVVVDRFSKYATFIPASKLCPAEEAARIFLKHVVKYWRVPKAIISD